MSKLLEKVNKLLKLYEGNPDGYEGTSALKKSAALMRKFIDEDTSADTDRIKRIEKREQAVDKYCTGCSQEKPTHHPDCLIYSTEKKIGQAGVMGCFGCAGILFVSFLSMLTDLIIKIFG